MFYKRTVPLLPGLLLVLALAAVAVALGGVFPLIGSAVMGIFLGIVVRWRFPPDARFNPGIAFSSKQVLQWSIVALGFGLPIAEVAKTGMDSLSITLATISAAFLSALCFGKLLRVPGKLCVLIGTGTAICGGSAIAAITPVLKPDAHEASFSLSTIFLFNVLAVLLFPLLGHALGLSDRGFGLWAGTAINDTSSVVAAAYSWSESAGEYATIVKLTRAMLIVPVTLAIGAWVIVRQRKDQPNGLLSSIGHAFPWFIAWFVVASAAGRFLPPSISSVANGLAPLMITAALTAIGLTTDLTKMRQTGWRPVALGLLVWISVAATSLVVQSQSARW